MQIHTLDKAGIINELQFGNGINQAVHEGRRADFGLLLSMFSSDVRDTTPVEMINQTHTTEQLLRQRFELPVPQPLSADQSSYAISAHQAAQFHDGGLPSAKLCHYLTPDALAYLPEGTHGLPEAVYHNLSGHQRRQLAETEPRQALPADLYNQLVRAQRQAQIQLTA